MPLYLVKNSNHQRGIEMFQSCGNAASKKHIAHFIHIIFQHTVLVIQFIQIFANFCLLISYSYGSGYAVFTSIDIAAKNEDYYITGNGVANQISNYDRIVLNAKDVKDDDILV